jgi:hypothetical protein
LHFSIVDVSFITNLLNPDPTIPHPFQPSTDVPPIVEFLISVVPPVIKMKGEVMETESDNGFSEHPLILNVPLSNVMIDVSRLEENERDSVDSVRDPLVTGKITSVDVSEIPGFDVPK